MNILFLCRSLPTLEVPSGEFLRIANQVRVLAALGHRVHVLCTYKPPEAHLVNTPMPSGIELETFASQVDHPLQVAERLAKRLARRGGFMRPVSHPALLSRARALLAERAPGRAIDVLHIDNLSMGSFFLQLPAMPSVWFPADSATLALKVAGEDSAAAETLRFERKVLSVVKPIVFFVADVDRDHFLSDHPGVDTRTAPNGVWPEAFPQVPRSRHPDVLFSGVMAAPHNARSALWYLEKVHPIVRRSFPEARCWIVGPNPPKALAAHSGINGAVITGKVPSVAEYMTRARVSIAPMIMGSGMLNKIQEAACSGIPMVVTPMAARGLNLEHNVHALIESDPTAFAQAVIKLMSDDVAATALAERARNFIVSNYQWQNHAQALVQAYNDARARSARSAA